MYELMNMASDVWGLVAIAASIAGIAAALTVFSGVIGTVIGPFGRVGLWLTKRWESRIVNRFTDEKVSAFLDRIFKKSGDPLLRGDRRAFAEAECDPKAWPTYYMDIPADVRRPVVWDGRIIGCGRPITWLAWRYWTPEVAGQIVRRGVRSGIAWAALAFVALTIAVAVVSGAVVLESGGIREYPEWAEGVSWTPAAAYYLLTAGDFVSAFVANLPKLAYAAAAAVLFGFAAAIFSAWHVGREWWNSTAPALRRPSRDSLLMWKSRAEVRSVEYAAYVRQCKNAAVRLAHLPTIEVGKAMGVLRARGDMEAPSIGQAVCMDGETARLHTMIKGGTGEGKTRNMIKPLFARIMSAAWPEGHSLGCYVTDGKGNLHLDLAPVLEEQGRDFVVIGTGEGEFGLDLLAGMTPLEVSSTLKAVYGQVMGAGGDQFWPEAASLAVMHSATVARVLDADPDTVNENPDYRPWSFLGIGEIALDGEALKSALDRIETLWKMPAEDLGEELSELVNDPETTSAYTYLATTWQAMASETRSGIQANINAVLGKFAAAGELRRRFATGRFSRLATVEEALYGGCILNAVSEAEWGIPGKVVSIWAKTRLYTAARKKLQADPKRCETESCLFIADEFQMLATTGPDSDSSFWNIARQTGVFAIVSTQSLAALRGAIGKEATENLLNLFRNKVFLKTEEPETLDYALKLAGEIHRGFAVEQGFFETVGMREILYPDTGAGNLPDVKEAASNIVPSFPGLSTAAVDTPVRLDRRFFRSVGMNGGDDGKQAAYWRQEDKQREALLNTEVRPKLNVDELLIGGGHAFAIIQRAGLDRSDIIDIERE